MTTASPSDDLRELADKLRLWGAELGFAQVGITDTQLDVASEHLRDWLAKGYHGDMNWLAERAAMRSQPELLEAGTLRVITLRMNYWPEEDSSARRASRLSQLAWETLADSERAYVSRYALGRDYHKLMRKRLAKLADRLRAEVAGSTLGRALVDSAPVMEKPLAEKAGIGWQGKHTLIINKQAGSYFFLGEIYTDIPLPIDPPASNHCGSCSACIDICPTAAIVAPYQLDARRCITYQTIENKGSIDPELRPLMGNRVFGCDDCQLVCPWNKFAEATAEGDFQPRHGLDQASLVELFSWTQEQFLENTKGSAIRRTGYQSWLRNLAVGLGNGPATPAAIAALLSKRGFSALLDEHIEWALERLQSTEKT